MTKWKKGDVAVVVKPGKYASMLFGVLQVSQVGALAVFSDEDRFQVEDYCNFSDDEIVGPAAYSYKEEKDGKYGLELEKIGHIEDWEFEFRFRNEDGYFV